MSKHHPSKTARHRLDQELVDQGLCSTRDEAYRLILAGDISTTDRRLSSPGEQVRPGIALHVRGRLGYVGRGALKLERALDAFDIKPTGLRCLDVGCSTGGFTDCLLQRGARKVIAVDVGYAQFDWRLREDARVELHERTNIVDLPQNYPSHSIDLAVCDVSFTSIKRVLPAVMELLQNEGQFITLVKPQFELLREDVDEGGVVKNHTARQRALASVVQSFVDYNLAPLALCPSPITGHKGNHEYLLLGSLCTAISPQEAQNVLLGQLEEVVNNEKIVHVQEKLL